jgi:hypothetical protein
MDLSSQTELLLIGVLAVVWMAFFTRTVVFFRREKAGVHPLYPDSWNVGQRIILEKFRLLVGLGLLSLWAVFFAIRPASSNSSFGYLEILSLIAMLSISYAWVLLLAPRDLKWLETFPQSFALVIAFLVVWWGTAFTAMGWMFAEAAAASTPIRLLPNGVFA